MHKIIKDSTSLKHCFLVVNSALITLTLSACGAGGGGDSANNSANQPINYHLNLDSQIPGSAVKGIIQNGIVRAYEIDNGVRGSVISQAITGANGTFNMPVSSQYTGPVLFELTAGTDTTMTCDSNEGCGATAFGDSSLDTNGNNSVDFGERFTLPSDFLLTTAVNGNNQASAHITTISHMAASYAASLNGGLSGANVAVANSQITQLFNLTGDISDIVPIDLTDSAAVTAATEAQSQLSILSVAMLDSLDNDSIADQISRLAADFSNNHGQLAQNNARDGSQSLDTITTRAAMLARSIEREDNAVEFNRMKLVADRAESGTTTEAAPSPTVLADNLVKAKAFANDLQLWKELVNVKNGNSSQLSTMAAKRSEFEDVLAPALKSMEKALGTAMPWGILPAVPEMLINGACESVAGVLANTCKRLINLDTLESQCANSDLVLFGKDLCEVLADIPVHKTSTYSVRYQFFDGTVTVAGVINGQTVDLIMSVDTKNLNAFEFNASGSVNSDTASLTLDSSIVSFNFAEAINVLKLKLPESIDVKANGTIAQLAEASVDPMQFTGNMALNIDLSNASEANSDQSNEETLEQTRSLIIGENLSYQLSMDGDYSTQSGEAYESKLVIVGKEETNYSLTVDITSVDLSANAVATLAGKMTTADQDSASSNDYVLELAYDGKLIEVAENESEPNTLQVSNQDNVQMDINKAIESGLVGSVLIGNVSMGDIYKADEIYSITYSDGSSQTLF